MKVGSMFSGVGGLDLAVHQLFPDAEPAWFFEWEDAPSAVLAEHWPDVPNHRDVSEWDAFDLDPIDVLVGGFPCQDISHAGKQAGIKEGTRSGLWYRMADAIGVLRPRLVLLENVSAITSNGGSAVVGSLAAMGYVGRAGVVRASSVGACHRRERWFCVAYPHGEGPQGRAGNGDTEPAPAPHGRPAAQGAASTDAAGTLTLLPTPTAETGGDGQREDGYRRLLAPEMKRLTQLLPTPTAVQGRNATSGRQPDAVFNSGTTLQDVAFASKWGDYAAAIARWEHVLGRPAPAPTDDKGRLSPAFTEWMMGWPDGWTEPAGSRAKRLKACGNGVVPQQALAAYSHLLSNLPQGAAA